MKLWRVSAGLTAALAGSVVLASGSPLEYLAPFWRVILPTMGWLLQRIWCWLSLGPSATVSPEPPDSADLGRRVDLVERSIRRGEGDPELADALRGGADGDWE